MWYLNELCEKKSVFCEIVYKLVHLYMNWLASHVLSDLFLLCLNSWIEHPGSVWPDDLPLRCLLFQWAIHINKKFIFVLVNNRFYGSIRTHIVGQGGKHADHLTTTMVQRYQLSLLTLIYLWSNEIYNFLWTLLLKGTQKNKKSLWLAHWTK